MVAGEANGYAIALIGAGSALVGVLVAALVQALAARAVQRSQREALRIQAAQQHQQRLRDDRLQAYSEYLDACNSCLYVTAEYVNCSDEGKPQASGILKARSQMNRKREMLRIVAGVRVTAAAFALYEHLSNVTNAALIGEPKPPMPDPHPWPELIRAIKEELRIDDDPEHAAHLPQLPYEGTTGGQVPGECR